MPKLQGGVFGDALKVLIAGQHLQAMTHAQLRQKRVDSPYLNTMASACVAKQRSFCVIGSIGNE